MHAVRGLAQVSKESTLVPGGGSGSGGRKEGTTCHAKRIHHLLFNTADGGGERGRKANIKQLPIPPSSTLLLHTASAKKNKKKFHIST